MYMLGIENYKITSSYNFKTCIVKRMTANLCMESFVDTGLFNFIAFQCSTGWLSFCWGANNEHAWDYTGKGSKSM